MKNYYYELVSNNIVRLDGNLGGMFIIYQFFIIINLHN